LFVLFLLFSLKGKIMSNVIEAKIENDVVADDAAQVEATVDETVDAETVEATLFAAYIQEEIANIEQEERESKAREKAKTALSETMSKLGRSGLDGLLARASYNQETSDETVRVIGAKQIWDRLFDERFLAALPKGKSPEMYRFARLVLGTYRRAIIAHFGVSNRQGKATWKAYARLRGFGTKIESAPSVDRSLSALLAMLATE
jgi:hypothetical protein